MTDEVTSGAARFRTDAVPHPMSRFGVDALRYLVAQLIPALTGFLSAYVFTRLLSTEQYGVYSMVLAVVTPASVLVTEWAAQPVGRFFSEFYVGGRLDLFSTIFFRLTVAVLAAALAAALLTVWSGGSYWGLTAAWAAATLLVIESLSNLMLPVLPASLDAESYRFVQVGRAVLKFGVSALLVAAFRPTAELLLWGTAAGSLVMTVPLAQRVRRHLTPAESGAYHGQAVDQGQVKEQFRRFVRYGLPMMAWFLGAQLMHVGDRYVIEAYLGSSAVGLYSATYNVINGVAGLLAAPVSFAAFPIIMRLWAEGRVRDTQNMISEMTAWYGLLATWLVGEIALVGEDVLALVLGPEFRAGWVIALPVIMGLGFWHASMLGHKSLEISEQTELMARLAVGAAVFNVAANLVAVPRYGIEGAAWTTLVSYLLYCVLVWVASSRRRVQWQIPWQAFGVMAVAGLLGFAVADRLQVSGFLGILLQGTVFTVLLFGFCACYLAWNRKFHGVSGWCA